MSAISAKNSKRILSVTIRRMLDESPDTSWLGEYSNRPKTEYAIDRAHAEDCDSQRLQAEEGKDQLERVRVFLEDNAPLCQSHTKPQELFCSACQEETFWREASEIVWELEKSAGECDCSGGDMGRGELRYFNGPVGNYAGETPENIRKYIRQDYDRMESLNRGDWCLIGIRAEAEVQTGSDVVQRITSGGLWGIESDSEKDHFESTAREELAQLRSELVALGFSRRAIASAFKNVQEKGE